MSEFHKFIQETWVEYNKDGVEDPYLYKRKCQIFWNEVEKFNQ